MSEPQGIITEITISENTLKKYLKHKPFAYTEIGHTIGYFFCQLLYGCENNTGNVFLLNYDPVKEHFFCAWSIENFDENASLLQPFIEALQILAQYKDRTTKDYAIRFTICSTGQVGAGYEIGKQTFIKKTRKEIDTVTARALIEKFWTFMDKKSFPEPAKALRKRNYFYKYFKTIYKSYLRKLKEVEKPKRIAQATKENPYHLFSGFYSYDGKVFDFWNHSSGLPLEVPGADPLTIEQIGKGLYVLKDKQHVFAKRLQAHSPPAIISTLEGVFLPNRDALWEYVVMDKIDGKSFTYLCDRSENVYWKDKHGIYVEAHKDGIVDYNQYNFVKVEKADVCSFRFLDFCFGKDKNHVFFKDKILAIDPGQFTLNRHGFLYDDKNIYYYNNKVPLDAKTFKVRSYNGETNPFLPPFVLEDKDGTYEYKKVNNRLHLNKIQNK